MTPFTPGPTYQEMLHPHLQPSGVRRRAESCRDELDPIRLFDISWRDAGSGSIRHVLLPGELTGVAANILVLVGREFPSGSHKVGPAYTTLMEGELAGEIDPAAHTIVAPSTGNFGIGAAYVARLKRYPAIVIMPEGMSQERYQRIRQYGSALDLTPGSESDVILVLERTRHYRHDPRYRILAQFELLPNYRFHRYVTGLSAIEAALPYGDGRIAAFVSAPGSAGTLAAGDQIKSRYPDAAVCAVEPAECATLFENGRGTHRIEGIGDKMVTLIHNVLTTDYVMRVHDGDCLIGLQLLEDGASHPALAPLRGLFGVSGIGNVLAAIRLARYLGLGPEDNVVTIATDGFDRYPSVLAALPAPSASAFEAVFRTGHAENILDVRPLSQKQRLFAYKEQTWSDFGYSRDYLARMQRQSFWDDEFAAIESIDRNLLAQRRF